MAELQADWLEAAGQGGELARKLEPPADGQPGAPGAVAELAGATGRLDGLTRKLLAPFQTAAVQAIVGRCRSEAPPNPELALEVRAMLLTPFVAAEDRPSLLDARRTLDDRLEKTWNKDNSAGSAGADRVGQPGARARRRFERIAAFLNLAGDATTSRLLDEFRETIEHSGRVKASGGSDLPWDMSDPASVWSSMARCAELAYNAFDKLLRSDAPANEPDRPGWLAPAYLAAIGEGVVSPTRRIREKASRTTWSWLADHYRHESRDLHEAADPDSELELAARECQPDAQAAPEIALRIDGPTSAIRLSSRQSTATVDLKLILTGAGAGKPQKVALNVLEPDDPRLKVTAPVPSAVDVSSTDPSSVSIVLELSTDAPGARAAPPSGLIVRAYTPGGRTFHALIPLSIVSADMAPTLALSRNPALSDDLPMDRLRLRPIAGLRQPFHVFVKNPSDRSWSVIVEVLEGDKVVGSSGAKPLPVEAHSSIKVPDFGGPAPKPGAELPEPAAPLRLRLSDATRTMLDEQTLRAEIAAPVDYLEATRVEFVPDAAGQPNRLTVALRALPALAGPPCPVELVLPIDKELFPSLRELPRSGKLVGELAPGKSALTLSAEGITLDPGEDTEGSFYLNVNGVRRALWFRSRFPQIGGPQRAAESRRPRVRFVANPRVEPNKLAQLDVAFRVDDAPAGSVLDVRLGQSRDGQIGDGLTWSAPRSAGTSASIPGAREARSSSRLRSRTRPGIRPSPAWSARTASRPACSTRLDGTSLLRSRPS